MQKQDFDCFLSKHNWHILIDYKRDDDLPKRRAPLDVYFFTKEEEIKVVK